MEMEYTSVTCAFRLEYDTTRFSGDQQLPAPLATEQHTENYWASESRPHTQDQGPTKKHLRVLGISTTG